MLGILPIYIRMSVMVTENIDITNGIVIRTEGIVRHINYLIVNPGGHKHIQCAYVKVNSCGIKCLRLIPDVILIFPIKSSFTYNKEKINQEQLPLLPIFTYTDYKSQGHSLQSIYVMLL